MEMFSTAEFWFQLLAATILQIALSGDNLMVMSLQAAKLEKKPRELAIMLGLVGAMFLRIGLLLMITWLIQQSTAVLFATNWSWLAGTFNLKSIIFLFGGLLLVWNGIDTLRQKFLGVEEQVPNGKKKFWKVVIAITSMNIIFSLDSTFVVVAMTKSLPVMIFSVVFSLGVLLIFAKKMCDFISRKPNFEMLGIGLIFFIGFILFLEGAHEADTFFLGQKIEKIQQGTYIFLIVSTLVLGWINDVINTRKEGVPVHLHRKFEDPVEEKK